MWVEPGSKHGDNLSTIQCILAECDLAISLAEGTHILQPLELARSLSCSPVRYTEVTLCVLNLSQKQDAAAAPGLGAEATT